MQRSNVCIIIIMIRRFDDNIILIMGIPIAEKTIFMLAQGN